MSNIKGDFMDSNNIVVVNDVPHFSFKGNSYLEKLKNGLSLDFVFAMEDTNVHLLDNFEENVEEDYEQRQPLNHELFVEEYDYDVLPMLRKGKKVTKRRSNKNMKKNKIKQNGYDDKLHTIEVNLPSIYDEHFEWFQDYTDLNDDNNYQLYNSHLYNSYDSLDEWNFVKITDRINHYGINFDSLDEWNFANHTGMGYD